MRERGDGFRFAFESRQPLRVQSERWRKHLDRDLAIEPGVRGFVDFAHAAGAEGGEDLIRAQARAWPRGHWRQAGSNLSVDGLQGPGLLSLPDDFLHREADRDQLAVGSR